MKLYYTPVMNTIGPKYYEVLIRTGLGTILINLPWHVISPDDDSDEEVRIRTKENLKEIIDTYKMVSLAPTHIVDTHYIPLNSISKYIYRGPVYDYTVQSIFSDISDVYYNYTWDNK